MSGLRSFLVLVLIVCCTGLAFPGDGDVTAELTGAYTSASLSNSSTWGWFNPSKYTSWMPIEDDEFGLAAARIIWNHPKYPLFIGGEWYPTLEADGTVAAPIDGSGYFDRLTGEIETYDLALGQKYGDPMRPMITPWFGVTNIRIDEKRNQYESADDLSKSDYSSAKSRLWGLMGGVDTEIPVATGWYAIGTAVIRWAKGSRDANITTDDPPTTVTQSDDTSVWMWGAEVGVRWDSPKRLMVSIGWRYRDWTYDDGPASFSGPFVRLGVNF